MAASTDPPTSADGASNASSNNGEGRHSQRRSFLEDEVKVPKNLSSALEFDDPVQALHLYSKASLERASSLSADLVSKLESSASSSVEYLVPLPDLLSKPATNEASPDSYHGANDSNGPSSMGAACACSDSIYNSLQKIASGGSQASQEIRKLEQEKRDMDRHANDIAQALALRQQAQQAVQSLQAQAWQNAAQAVRPYIDWKQKQQQQQDGEVNDMDEEEQKEQQESLVRIREYAGEYVMQQLERTQDELQQKVLQLYQQAVTTQDLAQLGQLTPVLSTIQLESQALSSYVQFLKQTLQTNLQQAVNSAPQQPDAKKGQQQSPQLPFAGMARVYNAAVQCLRHHMPLVSHYLHGVRGDAAVVQLVHVQVEQHALPVLRDYQRQRQFARVSADAAAIASALEDMYGGRTGSSGMAGDGSTSTAAGAGAVDRDAADCGFSKALGTLADVDSAMEEAALCLQQTESYLRFLQHTCQEVNNARYIRFCREREAAQHAKERHEWEMGRRSIVSSEETAEYKELQILPPFTPLHQAIAELGGQYAGIEHCLLLASMQRSFSMSDEGSSARLYYRPLSLSSPSGSAMPANAAADEALQTVVVDTCLYAARRSTQRAFATGHTGTASAVANFCSDSLMVLLEVLSQRAEDFGVARLKPGEGLLVGSAGIFHTLPSNLMRSHPSSVVGAGSGNPKDEMLRKQQIRQGIAHACAMLNDLEVAVHHTQQLEKMLLDTTNRGYAAGHHDTEQLVMCVKSLKNVSDSFHVASNAAVESLESVLRPRIRSIVGEAIGTEGGALTSTGGFMSASSALNISSKATDRGSTSRLNYNLDEQTFNLLQVTEGYITRLCNLLDELFNPLRVYLAPRLWDKLLLDVLGTVSKRLETSLRKCQFTVLGALALDSDLRDLISYAKDHLNSNEFSSNVSITRSCAPLGRLLQISMLLNVDELDDVLDLISSLKRKKNWELELDTAKTFLRARVDFNPDKVNEVLRLPDED